MKKKVIIAGLGVMLLAVAVIFLIHNSEKWSEKSFEAIVQETVIMTDGEIRLIVERTTEIYGNPLNSLHIGKETKLVNIDGKTISADDLQPGSKVVVSLKDAFTEETPFHYPTVYKVKILSAEVMAVSLT